jgi:hypothetical protein
MLAQSTNAMPSAATSAAASKALTAAAPRDPGGASPASALLGGAGRKKASGIAGLFSEILTQAQKNFSAKGGDSIKGPASGAEKEGLKKAAALKARNETLLRAADRGEKTFAARKPYATIDQALAAGKGKAGAEKAETPADARASNVAATRAGREKSRASAAGDPEAGVVRAADDKRRAKDKRDSATDDAIAASASAGGSAGAKAISANVAPRAKASQPGADAGSTIEKTDSRSERGSAEPKVTLLDLRRSAESRRGGATGALRDASPKPEQKAEDSTKEPIREAKAPGSGTGQEIYRELSLDTRGPGESPYAGKAEASSGRGQDFQSMMAERMRDAWNGEIVQSAHIVLKDGDAGIIRLRLRPESLGNVKIELNLSENNISGRIVVESDEAKNAFERNMNDLSDAFKQGGFDSARLEVSVGGSSAGGTQAGGAQADGAQGDSRLPYFSERLRDAGLSRGDTGMAASAYSRRGGAVDILA